MALALARKYRPRTFSDLLVQDHVAQVLRGAVTSGRVGHGYLLTGPRGVGKTTAARILAMALNCEQKAKAVAPGEPCGVCPTCERIWNGSANLDVVEIDAASNRGVDDARDLRERAMYAASGEGHYKVYIVDEAHMLTREAWNALLKILEEPPPRVVFVFATTEVQKIANTAAPVLSRLQRFDFRRIGPAAIHERLTHVVQAEKLTVDDDALTLIARFADGGMRDALSVLDQCISFGAGTVTARQVRETLGLVADELYAEVLGCVVDRDPARVFAIIDKVTGSGADLGEFLSGCEEALRALLMVQLGARPEGLTEGFRQMLETFKSRLQPGDALRMLKLAGEAEGAVRRSGNQRLVVETLLLRWAMMDRVVDLEKALAASGPVGQPAGQGPSGQGGGSTPAPAGGSGNWRAMVPKPEEPAPKATSTSAPADPAPSTQHTPSAPTPQRPSEGIEFSLPALKAFWPSIIDAVKAEKRLLGTALADTVLVAVAAPLVAVALKEENPMVAENLERSRDVVERIIGARVGAPVRLEVRPPEPTVGAGVARPKRRTDASDRAERLQALRAKDPALDAVAEALDLEMTD
ncbi:MAG TPA: DNA polymerase III subunit gamma/tau [Gemmatimonadales bacterium]|nr:DNA polymerase III subunit gamma/tau [Gemmatimonadales bacterium]